MGDGGKGSRPRPFSVSQSEFDNRFEAIFGKKKKTDQEKFDEAIGFDRGYNAAKPVELTDEQILCLWDWWSGEDLSTNVLDFADTYRRALLGEAGLVKWHQAYVKKMNEQDPA